MRALVTGSAGFVGRHLCPKLEQRCYAIGYVDPSNKGKMSLKPRVSLEEFIEHFPVMAYDVVIHLAARIINVDDRMKAGMSAYEDIELDLAMCKWLEKNPPKECAVLISSCAVDYPDDPYCIVKRNLESFAKTLHKKGVPLRVLRPFSGYGPDQSEHYPFPSILGRAMRKEDPLTVWGGRQVRDWVHVEDLTDAIMFAIDNCPDSPEPIEVGTLSGHNFFKVARLMAGAIGYNPEIAGDDSKASSSKHRVSGVNGCKVLQEYGWQPKITLKQGIEMAIGAAVPA